MWSEVGERSFFGPAVINEAKEGVVQVRENLRVTQIRQTSYVDNQRRDFEFEVGYYVYLKVSPLRGTARFHVRGKLAPRNMGPVIELASWLMVYCYQKNYQVSPHIPCVTATQVLETARSAGTNRITRYPGHNIVQGTPGADT